MSSIWFRNYCFRLPAQTVRVPWSVCVPMCNQCTFVEPRNAWPSVGDNSKFADGRIIKRQKKTLAEDPTGRSI